MAFGIDSIDIVTQMACNAREDWFRDSTRNRSANGDFPLEKILQEASHTVWLNALSWILGTGTRRVLRRAGERQASLAEVGNRRFDWDPLNGVAIFRKTVCSSNSILIS